MPEYLAPGVYVEEVDTGSKPIEGVSTSTAGMVGVTERGPVNVPILITGFGEFTRWFGERLNTIDFPNGTAFLPHGVEGFFTNGGKRMYVTRVVDTDLADRAETRLFDRGGVAGFANTMLLRQAAESTGSAANPPRLLTLSGAGLTPPGAPPLDTVRIGDGSPSEYVTVQAILDETTTSTATAIKGVVVPLTLPLGRSYAGTSATPVKVEQFARAVTAAGALTVADAAGLGRGETSVQLTGAAANITTLMAAASLLLELGGPTGELRLIRPGGKTQLSPTLVRVDLDSALLEPYTFGDPVQILDLPPTAAIVQTANLDPGARAGDCIVFVDDRKGDFDTAGNLVVINRADPTAREVRRIGELHVATLQQIPTETYPLGALVEPVTMPEATTTVIAPAPGAGTKVVKVADISLFSPGQSIVLDLGGGTAETATIDAVDPAASQLTLVANLVSAKAVTNRVLPLRGLTAATRAGATFLALDNRLGLVEGDVLRVGAVPNEEYVVVAALPSRAPTGVRPDAGNVVLSSPLAMDHDLTTQIVRLTPPVAAALQSTALAVASQPGTGDVLLADGTAYAGGASGTLVRISSADGAVYHRLAALAAKATPHLVTLVDPLLRAHPVGSVVLERRALLNVQALDPGAWGNRLRISVEDEADGLARTSLSSFGPPTHIQLGSTAGVEAGTILELRDGGAAVGALLKVVSVNRATGDVILATGLDVAQQNAHAAAVGAGRRLEVRSREFRITVRLLRQPDVLVPSRNETVLDTELFRNLSMDVRHSRYAPAVLGRVGGPPRLADRRPEGESWYVRLEDVATTQADLESLRLGPEPLVDVLMDGRRQAARHALAGGGDSISTLTDAMYIGNDDPVPELRTGLHSLRNLEDISIVAVPGRTGPQLQGALINHCELMRYRFAVLDSPPPPADSLNDVQVLRQQFDTKYAAIYYPWVTIPDPFPTTTARVPELAIPPSGHMVGVYARTDIERGVHKAPANEVVRGIVGLRRLITKEQQDILNPYPVNINVIRDFRPDNRGLRVYGGRVITSDSDYKYVNVRRLLIFLEHSIDQGLQWVVFEPNAEPLWARVRRSISNFLTLVWRNGALEGTKPEEAYFVKCDRTTMTQTDIDSGRLICMVGVAPVKPAEFVIVRIGLWTAHADN
jgi:phage tail sheath protein FI